MSQLHTTLLSASALAPTLTTKVADIRHADRISLGCTLLGANPVGGTLSVRVQAMGSNAVPPGGPTLVNNTIGAWTPPASSWFPIGAALTLSSNGTGSINLTSDQASCRWLQAVTTVQSASGGTLEIDLMAKGAN